MDEVRVQKSDRYWQAVIVDHLGKRRAKNVGRIDQISKRAAMTNARAWAVEFAANPQSATATPISLEQWTARYMATRTDISDLTLADHARTLDLLAQHFGTVAIKRLGRADGRDFRVWLEAQPGRGTGDKRMAEATIRKHIRNRKTIFSAAIDEGWTTDNPFAKEKSSVPDTPNDWTYVDTDTFNRLLDELPGEYRMAAAIARLAGLRLSEATHPSLVRHQLAGKAAHRPHPRRTIDDEAAAARCPDLRGAQ